MSGKNYIKNNKPAINPFSSPELSNENAQKEQELPEIDNTKEGKHLLSGFQGTIMIFKFTVGSGVFGIPASFKYSGILVGSICVLIIGILSAYGMKLIVITAWEVSKMKGITASTFGDVAEECAKTFNPDKGYVGRLVINFLLAFTAFILLIPIILFVANNFKQGIFQLLSIDEDIQVWIFVVFFILGPLFLIRRPDILALLSLFANISLAISMISLFAYIFTSTPSWAIKTTVTWPKVPLTIGSVSFAFEIAPFVLSIENVMKKPRQMPFIISGTMAFITFLYFFIGVIWYTSCQNKCEDSITLNLPTSWYFSLVKIFIGFSSCISTALMGSIIFNIIEPIVDKQLPEDRHTLIHDLIRVFVLTLSCCIAAAVPHLGNLMSLFGSIAVSIIGFIFPAVAHTIVLYPKLSRYRIAGNVALCTFGVLLVISGIYTSVTEIANDY